MRNSGDLWGKVFFLGFGLGVLGEMVLRGFRAKIYGLIFGRMGITGFWEYGFGIFALRFWAWGLGLGFLAWDLGEWFP